MTAFSFTISLFTSFITVDKTAFEPIIFLIVKISFNGKERAVDTNIVNKITGLIIVL